MTDHCVSCDNGNGDYRCKDCFGPHAQCRNCLLRDHQWLPFHRIQVHLSKISNICVLTNFTMEGVVLSLSNMDTSLLSCTLMDSISSKSTIANARDLLVGTIPAHNSYDHPFSLQLSPNHEQHSLLTYLNFFTIKHSREKQ